MDEFQAKMIVSLYLSSLAIQLRLLKIFDFCFKFLLNFNAVVAALNGPSPAAGCLLALAADYRIKANNPKFVTGLNETALGFAAPKWLAQTFIDQVGRREAYLALNLSTLYRKVPK